MYSIQLCGMALRVRWLVESLIHTLFGWNYWDRATLLLSLWLFRLYMEFFQDTYSMENLISNLQESRFVKFYLVIDSWFLDQQHSRSHRWNFGKKYLDSYYLRGLGWLRYWWLSRILTLQYLVAKRVESVWSCREFKLRCWIWNLGQTSSRKILKSRESFLSDLNLCSIDTSANQKPQPRASTQIRLVLSGSKQETALRLMIKDPTGSRAGYRKISSKREATR